MTEQNAIPVPQPDSPDVVRAAGIVKAVRLLWGFRL